LWKNVFMTFDLANIVADFATGLKRADGNRPQAG
jgi:hypothetical protein